MTLDDLFRRVVLAHLAVIVTCVALPVLAVVAMQTRAPAGYLGTVRLQVADTNPSSTTEADGMSSRVLALASSPGVIQQALDRTGLGQHRSAATMAAVDVTAQRLGESSVVELTVRDASRTGATRISRMLGTIVAGFMNNASHPHFDAVMRQTDRDLRAAQHQRDDLLKQVTNSVGPQRDAATIQLASADAEVGRLETQWNALVMADASRDQVVVVAPSRLDVVAAPSSLAARVVLGVLLGLVLGLAVAILMETLRPRAASVRAVARQLAAPVLGKAAEPAAQLRDRIARAARRHRLATVVVLGVEKADEAAVTSLLKRLNHIPPVAVPPPAEAPVQAASGAPKTPVKPNGRGGRGETRGETQVATLAPPRKATRTTTAAPVVFCTLATLDTSEEDRAGVLVVTHRTPRQPDVDATHALIAGMRWPVLGVLELSRRQPEEGLS